MKVILWCFRITHLLYYLLATCTHNFDHQNYIPYLNFAMSTRHYYSCLLKESGDTAKPCFNYSRQQEVFRFIMKYFFAQNVWLTSVKKAVIFFLFFVGSCWLLLRMLSSPY